MENPFPLCNFSLSLFFPFYYSFSVCVWHYFHGIELLFVRRMFCLAHLRQGLVQPGENGLELPLVIIYVQHISVYAHIYLLRYYVVYLFIHTKHGRCSLER